MISSFKIGDLGIKACLGLPFVEGTFLSRGDLRGECAYLSGCTFLHAIVVLGGDNTLGAFYLTTLEGFTLNVF
jgi:hypothetical protein